MPSTRRAVLRSSICGATAVLAGCTDDTPNQADGDFAGHVRPDADPAAVPERLDCPDDEFNRLMFVTGDIEWGETRDVDDQAGLSLRTRRLQYERGDRIEIRLRNTADETLQTATKGEYWLQAYTEAGWESLFGYHNKQTPAPFTALAVEHEPRERFDWSLPLTESGLVEEHEHHPHQGISVCPEPVAGRYRFVFRTSRDNAVAVAFDVVE